MPPKKSLKITSNDSVHSASGSQSDPEKGARLRGPQTTWRQREIMCQWLENPHNFALTTGAATTGLRNPVTGAKVSKKSAYGDLADYVNQRCGTNWDEKAGGARYKAYVKLYKDTTAALKDVNGAS